MMRGAEAAQFEAAAAAAEDDVEVAQGEVAAASDDGRTPVGLLSRHSVVSLTTITLVMLVMLS